MKDILILSFLIVFSPFCLSAQPHAQPQGGGVAYVGAIANAPLKLPELQVKYNHI